MVVCVGGSERGWRRGIKRGGADAAFILLFCVGLKRVDQRFAQREKNIFKRKMSKF